MLSCVEHKKCFITSGPGLVIGIRLLSILPSAPTSVAQLDVHPTGDQEVVDPYQICNILSWRFDHEIISTVILSLLLIQEGQLSVSGERICTKPVNCLED